MSKLSKTPPAHLLKYGPTWSDVARAVPDNLIADTLIECTEALVVTRALPHTAGALRRIDSDGNIIPPSKSRAKPARHPVHSTFVTKESEKTFDFEERLRNQDPTKISYFLNQSVEDTTDVAKARYYRAYSNRITRAADELAISHVSGKDCRGQGFISLLDSCAGLVQMNFLMAKTFSDGIFEFGKPILLGGVVPGAQKAVRYGCEMNSVAVMTHDITGAQPPRIRMWIDQRNYSSAVSTLGSSLVFDQASFLLPTMSLMEMNVNNRHTFPVDSETTCPKSGLKVIVRQYYCKLALACGDIAFCKVLEAVDNIKPVLILYNPRFADDTDPQVSSFDTRPPIHRTPTDSRHSVLPVPPPNIRRLDPLKMIKDRQPAPHRCNGKQSPASNLASDYGPYVAARSVFKGTRVDSILDALESCHASAIPDFQVPDVGYIFPAMHSDDLTWQYTRYVLLTETNHDQRAELIDSLAALRIDDDHRCSHDCSFDFSSMSSASSSDLDLVLAHRVAGHVKGKQLVELFERSTGRKIKNSRDMLGLLKAVDDCATCDAGKATRVRQSKVFNPDSLPCLPEEAWFCDTTGRTAMSLDKMRYVALAVNRKSGYRVSVLLQRKSYTNALIDDTVFFAKQHEMNVKLLIADQGSEYNCARFIGHAHQNGIAVGFTNIKSPAQNGLVERQWRLLKDSARTMLHSCKLPLVFWSFCVSYSVMIFNAAPRKELEGKSPYEYHTGRGPNTKFWLIFGADAILTGHVSGDHRRSPFSLHGLAAYYLGPAPNVRGGIFYVPALHRVVVSQNFKQFEERLRDDRVSCPPPLRHLLNEHDDSAAPGGPALPTLDTEEPDVDADALDYSPSTPIVPAMAELIPAVRQLLNDLDAEDISTADALERRTAVKEFISAIEAQVDVQHKLVQSKSKRKIPLEEQSLAISQDHLLRKAPLGTPPVHTPTWPTARGHNDHCYCCNSKVSADNPLYVCEFCPLAVCLQTSCLKIQVNTPSDDASSIWYCNSCNARFLGMTDTPITVTSSSSGMDGPSSHEVDSNCRATSPRHSSMNNRFARGSLFSEPADYLKHPFAYVTQHDTTSTRFDTSTTSVLPFLSLLDTDFGTENSLTRLWQNLNATDLYGPEAASAGDFYDHRCFNQATISDLLHAADDALTPTWRHASTGKHHFLWERSNLLEAANFVEKRAVVLMPFAYASQGAKEIGSTTACRVKLDKSGNPKQYKVRSCPQGFLQRFGRDYFGGSGKTPKPSTVRLICIIAVFLNKPLRGADIVGAYLEAYINVECWARVFPSWNRQRLIALDGSYLSMLVIRAVYGLKQSAQCFLDLLDSFLSSYGFRISMGDDCLFIYYKIIDGATSFIFLSCHIDDVQAVSSDDATWDSFAAAFTTRFPCKDVGDLDFHLGVSINHDRVNGTMQLTQRPLIEKTARILGLQPDIALRKKSPMLMGLVLQKPNPDATLNADEQTLVDNCPYREAVGALLYIYLLTRPNIGNALHQLCRFGQSFSIEHVRALKHLVAYLLFTRDDGVTYHANTSIVPYMSTDSTWASDLEDAHSTYGFGIMMCGSLMEWGVGRSSFPLPTTMDAESYCMREGCSLFIGCLKVILSALPQLAQVAPYLLLQDNQSSIDLARGLGRSSKKRHIRLRVLYVVHLLAIKLFRLGWIPTGTQWSDIFGKALGPTLFRQHTRTILGDRRPLRTALIDDDGNDSTTAVTPTIATSNASAHAYYERFDSIVNRIRLKSLAHTSKPHSQRCDSNTFAEHKDYGH